MGIQIKAWRLWPWMAGMQAMQEQLPVTYSVLRAALAIPSGCLRHTNPTKGLSHGKPVACLTGAVCPHFQIKNPSRKPAGVIYLKPGDDLLSHGDTPHYHRRGHVSLLSSGWGQVVPCLYGRQANWLELIQVLLSFKRPSSCPNKAVNKLINP